eukprot:607948-Amphidinium_carterae.1
MLSHGNIFGSTVLTRSVLLGVRKPVLVCIPGRSAVSEGKKSRAACDRHAPLLILGEKQQNHEGLTEATGTRRQM